LLLSAVHIVFAILDSLKVLSHGLLELRTKRSEVTRANVVNVLSVDQLHKFEGTSGAVVCVIIAVLKAEFFPFPFTFFAVCEPLVDPPVATIL